MHALGKSDQYNFGSAGTGEETTCVPYVELIECVKISDFWSKNTKNPSIQVVFMVAF